MNPRQQSSSNSMASQRGLTGDASLWTDTSSAQRSWISELVDGESAPTEAQWEELRAQTHSQEDWALYQLVGDVLRSPELTTVKSTFSSRVMAALEAEPVILSPRRSGSLKHGASFKRWIMPSMAVAAAAATVVWIAVPQLSDSRIIAGAGKTPSAMASKVAVAPPAATALVSVAAPASPATMLPATVDPVSLTSMERYLIAHQQVSPSASRHGMAPMVRITTVSSESR